MRMCDRPPPLDMETRKQSPKPTRYIRMRIALPLSSLVGVGGLEEPLPPLFPFRVRGAGRDDFAVFLFGVRPAVRPVRAMFSIPCGWRRSSASRFDWAGTPRTRTFHPSDRYSRAAGPGVAHYRCFSGSHSELRPDD